MYSKYPGNKEAIELCLVEMTEERRLSVHVNSPRSA